MLALFCSARPHASTARTRSSMAFCGCVQYCWLLLPPPIPPHRFSLPTKRGRRVCWLILTLCVFVTNTLASRTDVRERACAYLLHVFFMDIFLNCSHKRYKFRLNDARAHESAGRHKMLTCAAAHLNRIARIVAVVAEEWRGDARARACEFVSGRHTLISGR